MKNNNRISISSSTFKMGAVILLVLASSCLINSCKSDKKIQDEHVSVTKDSILANIDGERKDSIEINTKKTTIDPEIKEMRDSILTEQIKKSKLIEMSCDQILKKYQEAMKAAKAGDNTKLLAIDPNDPVFNGCRSSEPYKSKFEAIDLEYQD